MKKKSKPVLRINITRILYFLAVLAIAFLFIIINKDLFLRGIGGFLVLEDAVKPADAIVVLGGHEKERVQYAAQLYDQGFSKLIVMSGRQALKMKQQAVLAGVPQDKILLETKTMHTYQHPLFVKALLKEQGIKSVIVVSSPYHMRRVKMLFDRAFHNSGITLLYCPAEKSWFDARHWWRSSDGRRVIYSEYVKMAVNALGVRVNDAICVLLKKENQPIIIGY